MSEMFIFGFMFTFGMVVFMITAVVVISIASFALISIYTFVCWAISRIRGTE